MTTVLTYGTFDLFHVGHLRLIERLRERGLGVIVISHNMADVQAVADRLYVLRLGRNAAEFKIEDVTTEQLVAAITGASDEVVSARKARESGRDVDPIPDSATPTEEAP